MSSTLEKFKYKFNEVIDSHFNPENQRISFIITILSTPLLTRTSGVPISALTIAISIDYGLTHARQYYSPLSGMCVCIGDAGGHPTWLIDCAVLYGENNVITITLTIEVVLEQMYTMF